MDERDCHSVTVNIPRPRVLDVRKTLCNIKKKSCKRTYKKPIRKPSETSLRKYSLQDDTHLNVDDFKNDDLLLPYKLYTKSQKSFQHKQRLRIKIQEKYKIINIDLRNRLHVEHPPDDVKAVTDIDETFFRYFDSHPLAQYIPLYKSRKFQFHQQLRMRQEVGYRNDCTLNIEVNHRREEHTYERTVQRYLVQVKLFDAFISQDYQNSMACLKNADDLASQVRVEIDKLHNLANKQFTIQSRLIGLDYMYFMQQKYGRFLYYLSPPSWRYRNREFAHSVEIEAKGFDLGTSSEEDTFTVIFEKMQNECLMGLVKPVLFFSHPSDLKQIFENIAKQQLHHFSHVTHLAPHTKTLKNGIKRLKSNIENETALVKRQIDDLQILVEFMEDRKKQLQAKFMKILHGLFYDSVASTDVLKLQLHLEFCYEKLYREKAQNTTLVSNAKAIENMYMEYSYKLDIIHGEKIKLYMKQCNEREKIKMKKATDASRELRLFDNLTRALLRTQKPSINSKPPLPVIEKPVVKIRKRRQVPKPIEKISEHRDLTDAQLEYLALFTEWTDNEDPGNYLQSLTVEKGSLQENA